jgi:hypothetical protein
MNFDETAEVRFLPDLDAENPFGFVVQNIYHVLEINGKTRRDIARMKTELRQRELNK